MALPDEAVELAPSELSFPLRGDDLGRTFEVTGAELNAVHLKGEASVAGRVGATVVGVVALSALIFWFVERGGR
jgi:hypothetical protein